jgi:hypothetical protein
MNFQDQFTDKDFGVCKIIFRKEIKFENVCLFASHTFSPLLPEYVYYYLNEIKKAGLSLIFISSSEISDIDKERLSLLAELIVEKENKGTDFGAWCAVLRYLDYGKAFKTLYLCNDSVFGPLIPLVDIHKKFLSIEEEVLGITDSHQGVGYHIQSYFVGLKQSVLRLNEWQDFWKKMHYYREKGKVIEFYEIGLSRMLIKAGIKCFIWTDWAKKMDFKAILAKVSESDALRPKWLNRILYEQKKIIFDINPCSFLWKELIIHCGNPFIKRELFIYDNLFKECEIDGAWEPTLNTVSSYPTSLIKYFLLDHFLNKIIKALLKENGSLGLYLPIDNEVKLAKMPHDSEESFLFASFDKLISKSSYKLDQQTVQLNKQLLDFGIDHRTMLLLLANEKHVSSTLIYLTNAIVEFDQLTLNKIKIILKRIYNPVIIVPDRGTAAIISSILSLRSDGFVLEKEFYIPSPDRKIIQVLKRLIEGNANRNINLFQRPAISDIVEEALCGTDNLGFTKRGRILSEMDVMSIDYNYGLYPSKEVYSQYLAIKDKYRAIYENTPLWYKKVGHILKLLKGNKRFIVGIEDKGKKETYMSTVEDITHWYYLQYEVLPEWYKKIGKKISKNNDR